MNWFNLQATSGNELNQTSFWSNYNLYNKTLSEQGSQSSLHQLKTQALTNKSKHAKVLLDLKLVHLILSSDQVKY